MTAPEGVPQPRPDKLPQRDQAPGKEKRPLTLKIGMDVRDGIGSDGGQLGNDRAYSNPKWGGIVCDGASLESAPAAQSVVNTVQRIFDIAPEHANLKEAKKFVREVLVTANDELHARYEAEHTPLDERKQTTGCLFYIWNGYAIFGNVGDTRGSLLRGGKLRDITLDQGEYYEDNFEDKGKVRAVQDFLSEALNPKDPDPQTLPPGFTVDDLAVLKRDYLQHTNAIEVAFGGYTPEDFGESIEYQRNRFRKKIDIYHVKLKAGDILGIGSDGTTDEVTRSERETVMNAYFNDEPQTIAMALNDKAIERHDSGTSDRAKGPPGGYRDDSANIIGKIE